jgi:hypothetical protein
MLFEMETDPSIEHTIYTGDWNISLSQQMDTHGYLHENNTHNRDFVKAKMIEHELIDTWRLKNPFETKFTFMKKQARNTTKARLDFVLISPQTPGYMESVWIDNQTSLSDHRPISFTIAKNKIENGPGYWRFDNELLNQPEFTFGMSNRILKTIKDNPAITTPPLPNTPRDPRDQDKLKPPHLMDMILMDARTYTIKYTATRKREENNAKNMTQNELNDTVRLLELDDGYNKGRISLGIHSNPDLRWARQDLVPTFHSTRGGREA